MQTQRSTIKGISHWSKMLKVCTRFLIRFGAPLILSQKPVALPLRILGSRIRISNPRIQASGIRVSQVQWQAYSYWCKPHVWPRGFHWPQNTDYWRAMEIKRSQSKEFRLWTVLKFKVWASLGTKLEQMVLTAFDAQQIARKATFNHHRGENITSVSKWQKTDVFCH